MGDIANGSLWAPRGSFKRSEVQILLQAQFIAIEKMTKIDKLDSLLMNRSADNMRYFRIWD